MATTWADLVTQNFTVSNVLGGAAPVVGALAVLVLGLSIGPRYGMKVLGWIKSRIG
jgi:hypothetical protein